MKNLIWWIPLLAMCGAHAQIATLENKAQPARGGEYAITERGPDHRVWTRVEEEPGPFGKTVKRVHSFVELATGMHFTNAKGELQEAEETIEQYPEGAVARRGQHKVIFANNLATPGAIDFETPDGKRLRSHIVGLSYFDTASGKSVLIAEVKDCEGKVSGNQVLYEHAFTDFKASVRYTYTRAGFEQDVVFLEQPPGPEVYGLDPATTKLQVLTEFLDPPQPRRPEKMVVDAAEMLAEGVEVEPVQPADESLDFGSVQIGLGWAFRETSGLNVGGRGIEGNVPVKKQWLKLDGRDVLVEEVPVSTVAGELRALPKGKEGAWKPVDGSIRHAVLKERRLPERRLAQRPERKRPMEMAMAAPTRGGFVVDYQLTLGSLSNYTFKGDTTYYVSGPVYLYGTSVLEGGAVVKYTNNANAQLRFYGPFDCQTSPYRPAFFTAKDDNTVGEDISGSSTTPSGIYAYSCLYWSSPPGALDVHDVRVKYANYGVLIYPGGGYSHVLRNSQLCNNSTAIYVDTSTLLARNLLIYSNWRGYCGYGGTLKAEHLTVDQASIGFYEWTTGTMSVTNSLLTGVSSWSMGFTSYNNVTNSNGIFQTAGGGAHYLAANSPYRNAGTTNINSDLATALRQRTTYPPIVYAGATISTDGNWGTQAQRDTDAPDLGYHYDPVDYLFGGSDVNANVTFTPGTVVGWYRLTSGSTRAGYGIHIGDNKVLNFDGRLEQPCWFVHQTVAQELLTGYSPYSAGPGGIAGWSASAANAPVLNLLFTKCSGLSTFRNYFRDDNGTLTVNATHCEFYVGRLGGSLSTVNLTNCFLDRTSFWLDGGGVDNSIALRNCTQRGGELNINRWAGTDHQTPVSIRDCVFDGTTNTTADAHYTNPAITDYSYNAFKTGATRTTPTNVNDRVVSSFDWQSGSLGSFYLPSGSQLFNSGSRSAASAGLSHFTLRVNNLKEMDDPPGAVDLGYHYVALLPTVSEVGVLAHWPFDEGTNTVAGDVAGGGYNGTLVSSPAWVSGTLGASALDFNGSNYVTVPDNAALRVGNSGADFSLSFWLNLQAGYNGSFRIIAHKGNDANERTFALWMYPNVNRIHARISTTAGFNEGSDSVSSVTLNCWTHVAYVKAGSQLRLYLNGVLDSETTLAGTSVSNTGPIYFGKDPWHSGTDCQLDDVRLYSRALLATEVLAMNTRIPGDTDGDGTPDYLDQDSDGDGLSDIWELHYATSLSVLGTGDYDGDGVSDLAEYLQGRNPMVGATSDTGGVTRLNVFTPMK